MNSERLHDIGLLLIRIAVGIIFIHAGWGKVTGIEGTQGFFGNIGIPAPALMAWFVALLELIGGIMVLVGVKIRIPAVLLAITMLVAILTTKLGGDDPFRAMRLDLVLMLASVALALTGPGRLSVLKEQQGE